MSYRTEDTSVHLHFKDLPAYGINTLNRSHDLMLPRVQLKDKLSNKCQQENVMTKFSVKTQKVSQVSSEWKHQRWYLNIDITTGGTNPDLKELFWKNASSKHTVDLTNVYSVPACDSGLAYLVFGSTIFGNSPQTPIPPLLSTASTNFATSGWKRCSTSAAITAWKQAKLKAFSRSYISAIVKFNRV